MIINILQKILSPFSTLQKSETVAFLLLALAYASVFFWQKPEYFLTDDLDFFLGVIFAPYIIRRVSEAKSSRYFWRSLLLFGVLLFWRSNTLYFFAFGFALLFLVESFFYRLNSLALLLLVTCSAVFRHVANIWTFSIRLKMTEWVGDFLTLAGFPIVSEGNVIYMDGQPFSVAPACMGLDMLVTAFVLSLMVLAYFERKYSMTIPLWKASLFCGVGLGLAIFSNLVRLAVLVVFRIMPENWMHDILGILSLVIYVLLPFFFLVRFFYRKKIKESGLFDKKISESAFLKFPITIVLHFLLIGLLWWTGGQFSEPIHMVDASFEKIEMKGFAKTIDDEGVLKLENDSLLIYIKPPVRIFQGTHDPRFCWRGSGYHFSKIQKKKIGNHEFYTAILTKGKDKLFTAWWLDNGTEKTIDEWTWRWKTLQGEEPFRLVNVTAEERDVLERWIGGLKNQKNQNQKFNQKKLQ